MKLPAELKQSAGWLFVKEYAEDRLVMLRGRLEADLTEAETAGARAAIREMKRLLGLEDTFVFTEIDE